ncbi:a959bd54-a1ad-498e-91dc-3b932f43ac2a [Sclerotinia trifoliorum]|uniref:A959bd54-a1ad-498e-91dc-3b932f43ac2a n=1 Tax=Sclerotinia trifoliorum TaxID=28548 RepID=A0A8H2VQ12_9HELO|nr:a959bd54-a1ad-498e-91dc-3b932f43ac2a [Sclerotinia trifoliorum]
MKGFMRAPLLVVVGVASFAYAYPKDPRGLSDIIAALEGGGKGESGGAAAAVTNEITKTMTVTKVIQGAAAPTGAAVALTNEITQTMTVTKVIQGAAAPTGAAIQAGGTGGQFSFLTSTVFASGAPPTVTVTPLPQMITQTVTKTEQVMVTMMATEMSVVTSMVTMTMMVSVTMEGAATVPPTSMSLSTSSSTTLTEAAIQGAPEPTTTTPTALQPGTSKAPELGAAQVEEPKPVDISTLSLASTLVLGNLAVATAI